MPSNALLVRSNVGWHEVTDTGSITTYGRKEALLSLGAQQSKAEAVRIAEAELEETVGAIREQITLEHRPATLDETPFVGYVDGDYITVDDWSGSPTEIRVTSIAVAQDNSTGELDFVPSFGDQFLALDADTLANRLEQTSRKMVRGTFSGRSKVATPAV